jgi:hypothetical protein
MVSLDGIGTAHDVRRPTLGGRPSFILVKRSIDRLRAAGAAPHLSITITGRNVEGVAAVVRFALDRDLTFTAGSRSATWSWAHVDPVRAVRLPRLHVAALVLGRLCGGDLGRHRALRRPLAQLPHLQDDLPRRCGWRACDCSSSLVPTS